VSYINSAIDTPMNNGLRPRSFLNLARQDEGSRTVCAEYVEQASANREQPPSKWKEAQSVCPNKKAFRSATLWLKGKGLNAKSRKVQKGLLESVLCDAEERQFDLDEVGLPAFPCLYLLVVCSFRNFV
jgi:hypothetical protein